MKAPPGDGFRFENATLEDVRMLAAGGETGTRWDAGIVFRVALESG
jgi:hypothetical protein